EPAREGLGINPLDEEDVREAQRPDFIQRVAEAAERSGIRGENLQAAGVHDQGTRRPLLEHRVRLLLLGWGGARTGSQAVKRPERGDSRDEPDEGAKTKCRVVHISPRRCTEKCGGSGSREAVRCAQFEPAVAATALSRRERWDEIEHHTARRPPLDLAAGAFRDHRVLAESGTAERTVEAELAQHR